MSRPLTARQRAFADGWAPGRAVEAAQAAGYAGHRDALAVVASKLLRHPRVRERILERLGSGAFAQPPPSSSPVIEARPPSPLTSPLVKGRGRGTATERIELLMGIGRSKKVDAKDRVTAILAAAELEGERRPARARPAPPAPIAAPMAPPPTPATSTKRGNLALVLNAEDERLVDGPKEPGA